ncbi:helix-turn-helix domain-containing protein [Streptococcus suis]|uniref:Transcriptional regulator n=1 Tax=Streptococcus suis TaxID=1307 RepID=A0AAD0L0D5_STRSU|nr:helix-turn-helix domain-containing protein [Streptococcus suis]AWX96425.1 transcriptional regulator [Streptococcus suis]AWX98425.1 transcriptional regulator [Streptococcus suis]MBS8056599.1 helix-turn-helix domain-containing protein [Streptococcus suis]MCL4942185.1 helix-turn-helix domain-containing protein [Streptococcus suis]HEM2802777.1 helix-turn-helix domain-containing protein [Streptococcus suis]
MLITDSTAILVRKKRAVEVLTKAQLAKILNVDRRTLAKIESGNYDAPKRIYQSVMEWLTE